MLPLIIQKRSENEEQAYCHRQNLHWDRDVREEVSLVGISCDSVKEGEGKTCIGLYCVDITVFKKKITVTHNQHTQI